MATKRLEIKTCDRCEAQLSEMAFVPGAPENARKPSPVTIDAQGMGGPTILFEDLCPKCIKRVGDLIGLIAKVGKSGEDEKPQDDEKKEAAPPAHGNSSTTHHKEKRA